jgi:hypothetical protein
VVYIILTLKIILSNQIEIFRGESIRPCSPPINPPIFLQGPVALFSGCFTAAGPPQSDAETGGGQGEKQGRQDKHGGRLGSD